MLKFIASLMFCCLFAGSSLLAQSTDENKIAGQVEMLKKAMVSGDTAALSGLTTEQLSYGHSNGLVEDKAAFLGQYVTGQSDFVTIDLSDQTIKISGDLAIVRHHLKADTNNSNVPGKVDLFVLLIWQKQADGQWKLVARQAVKVPATPAH